MSITLKAKHNKRSMRSIDKRYPKHILKVCKYDTCITNHKLTSDTITQICITESEDILNDEQIMWTFFSFSVI